jgi:uncharacterized protein YkwD
MKRLSRWLLVVVLAFFCGCGGGGSDTGSTSAPPPGGQGTGIPGIDGIRQEFLDAVNQARSEGRMCGAVRYDAAPPVEWNDTLAMAAYLHSFDMATHQFFSHVGSDGSSPGDRIAREGYAWTSYGENIAVNYPTVSSVVLGWLGSDGHCRNLMDPDFRDIGAAYSEGPYLGSPSARYWTFDLAAPR